MSAPEKSHTQAEVLEAAKEAALWSHVKWDAENYQGSLRTLELAPDSFSIDHFYTVRDVINARKHALSALVKISDLSRPANSGRILIYEPILGVQDGLSEWQTKGFFDINDCPPWDLWVGYVRNAEFNYVLSWIPDHLTHVANDAIELSCCDCLYWLPDDFWAR